MSGRVNTPLVEPELVDVVTKLRGEAASSPEYSVLEQDFTAILHHVVFGQRARRELALQPAVEP